MNFCLGLRAWEGLDAVEGRNCVCVETKVSNKLLKIKKCVVYDDKNKKKVSK